MMECIGEEEGKKRLFVDFLSLLPAELVLCVCLSLSAEDVTRCLLVNRSWYQRLSQLQPYWRFACTAAAGLSGFLLDKFGPPTNPYRGLFLATKNYLRTITAPPPCTVTLTRGYGHTVRYSPQYSKHNIIIGTLYHDFHPREMVVEVVRGEKLIRTHTLKVGSSRPEHRVVYGCLLQRDIYLSATASGRWSLYNLTPSPTPLVPSRIWSGDPLYDPELRLAACERCGLVSMAKLVSYHTVEEQSFWDLRLLHLTAESPPSHLLHFRLYHKNKDIIGRRVNQGKMWAWLQSKTPPTSSGVVCSEHMLLLQWANSIISHYLINKSRNRTVLSQSPQFHFLSPCHSLDSALYDNGGLNTEPCLSSDQQLVGVVFQARLHVWRLWNGIEYSRVRVPVRETFEQIRLLAVGHLLSVIGLEYSAEVLLILTLTGTVVMKCTGFAERHTTMVSPYIHMLCVSDEQWLNDLSSFHSSQRHPVIFWNKTNRCLEAILLGEEPVADDNQTPSQTLNRRTWWKIWK